jgi:hypothetical protein
LALACSDTIDLEELACVLLSVLPEFEPPDDDDEEDESG